MDITKNFKALSENLRFALAQMNIEVSAAQSTELIAQQFTQETWSQMRAGLQKMQEPRIGDFPGNRQYDSIEIDIGNGDGPQWYSLVDEEFEEELLCLVHDETALRAHLSRYAGTAYSTDNPEKETILAFYGPRNREHLMTVAEFLGVRYDGGGYWLLKDGRRIRFTVGSVYVPEDSFPFFVPKMMKSTKGCGIIRARWTVAGSDLAWEVIVPPSRDTAAYRESANARVIELTRAGTSTDVETFKKAVVTHARNHGFEAVFR
jgi:hypothetical protein